VTEGEQLSAGLSDSSDRDTSVGGQPDNSTLSIKTDQKVSLSFWCCTNPIFVSSPPFRYHRHHATTGSKTLVVGLSADFRGVLAEIDIRDIPED